MSALSGVRVVRCPCFPDNHHTTLTIDEPAFTGYHGSSRAQTQFFPVTLCPGCIINLSIVASFFFEEAEMHDK